MLASDVANPEFVNPTDPDAALSVEFYMDNPPDKWASDQKSYEENRKVVVPLHTDDKGDPVDMPYVRIMKPGDSTTIIVQPVREQHKRRFPQQWLYFASTNGLIEEHVQGWRVEEWDHLNKEQIRDLKHMRFHTVEQIAAASDSAVSGMGIMGPGLRIEAQKALKQTLANQMQENESKKDEEIADLKEQMATMQKAIENMGKAEDG